MTDDTNTTQKLHFKFTHPDPDKIVLVDLSNILITEHIINAAKQAGAYNLDILKLQMHPGIDICFKLNRIENMIKAMKIGIDLPPITIIRYKNTQNYVILEGRHRVAISLANNYTCIPAVIQTHSALSTRAVVHYLSTQ
jgi:hypothetical protein